MFNNFFPKSCPLSDNVEKYGIVGMVTDDNMTHVHCMLGTKGYTHTHTICNSHCFSTSTMVARKRFMLCYT